MCFRPLFSCQDGPSSCFRVGARQGQEGEGCFVISFINVKGACSWLAYYVMA